MGMRKTRVRWLLLSVMAAITSGAIRPSLADEPGTNKWQFSTSLYAWAVAMDGDVTIRNRTVDVDASFSDVIEASDSIFAFMATADATKGRWGLFFNPAYMKVSGEKGAILGPVSASVDATTEIAIIGFGGSYRIAEWPIGPGKNRSNDNQDQTVWLDAMVGGRYTYLKGEIDLRVTAASLGLSGQRVVEKSKSWVDPFIGARVGANMSENWSVQLRGDIGGFGVGSDFTWQTVALVGYRFQMFGHDANVAAGYRALYQDFEDGSGSERFVWDMLLHGPVLGLNVRF
ncbi:MAG: hypothetical protein V3S73_09795 [Gammaproteobacteria bacterium]